jgi:hypothetical protein
MRALIGDRKPPYAWLKPRVVDLVTKKLRLQVWLESGAQLFSFLMCLCSIWF